MQLLLPSNFTDILVAIAELTTEPNVARKTDVHLIVYFFR